MSIYPPHNPKPKTDQGGTSGKNLVDEFVRPMQVLTKSVIKISNKVQESEIYDETINDFAHKNR